MNLCQQTKQIDILTVGIEENAEAVINVLKEYVKLRRIKKVVLFMMNNNPIIPVESPFQWNNNVRYTALHNPNDYRMETIRKNNESQLLLVFSKSFHIKNAPFCIISQAEIHHCSYKRIKKSLIKADKRFQSSQQRLGL
jgi:hypothetical protein